jgi:hypothetical protein
MRFSVEVVFSNHILRPDNPYGIFSRTIMQNDREDADHLRLKFRGHNGLQSLRLEVKENGPLAKLVLVQANEAVLFWFNLYAGKEMYLRCTRSPEVGHPTLRVSASN